jgi:HSP20 family protein
MCNNNIGGNIMKKQSYLPSLFSHREEFLTPFDKMFDELMNSSFPTFGKDFGIDFFEKGSYPKCDIVDYKDKVRIELEIPGVDKSDICIEMKPVNGSKQLIISGKKALKTEDNENKQFIRRELKRSAFQRSFAIHDSLLSDKIDAEFKNGILIVDIPKKEPNETEQVTTKIDIK